MVDVIQWLATISGIIAAVMVATNLSARITGWGFVVFTGSSIFWIAFGVLKQEPPLTIQNAVLLVVNLIGIWRYLIARKPA